AVAPRGCAALARGYCLCDPPPQAAAVRRGHRVIAPCGSGSRGLRGAQAPTPHQSRDLMMDDFPVTEVILPPQDEPCVEPTAGARVLSKQITQDGQLVTIYVLDGRYRLVFPNFSSGADPDLRSQEVTVNSTALRQFVRVVRANGQPEGVWEIQTTPMP